jgi:hypothetical protein
MEANSPNITEQIDRFTPNWVYTNSPGQVCQPPAQPHDARDQLSRLVPRWFCSGKRQFLPLPATVRKNPRLEFSEPCRFGMQFAFLLDPGKGATVDAKTRLSSGVFLRIVDRSERAVRSAAVRNRYRELVRRAIPWAPVGEWRNLRPGEVDRRAPDASLWHQSAGAPPRQR